MAPIFYIILLTTVLSLALALPPALNEKSWKRLFIAAFLSVVGFLLPLFVFGMSAFMAPEAKSLCHHSWLDCFHIGKLALTPLVLWASAALYALEIHRVKKRTRAWLVLGLFLGAIVSCVCFVFGVVCVRFNSIGIVLIVPLYVAVWYSIRAVQVIRVGGLPPPVYLCTLLGSLPFWIAGVIWSRKAFDALPDQPSSCFVVTAATRGHESLVGPFIETTHRGRSRRANQQLITMWQFEELWRARAPRSHAAFRLVYNGCGPAVAKRIRSPWVADLAYVALKPVELLARKIVG